MPTTISSMVTFLWLVHLLHLVLGHVLRALPGDVLLYFLKLWADHRGHARAARWLGWFGWAAFLVHAVAFLKEVGVL